MRSFQIDCEKWVCGVGCGAETELEIRRYEAEVANRLGRYPSLLLNRFGYMCCLGQISEQLGVSREVLFGVGLPSGLRVEHNRPIFGLFVNDSNAPTKLAIEAASINDDLATTVEFKIHALKRLFAKHNIKLEFINMPSDERECAP